MRRIFPKMLSIVLALELIVCNNSFCINANAVEVKEDKNITISELQEYVPEDISLADVKEDMLVLGSLGVDSNFTDIRKTDDDKIEFQYSYGVETDYVIVESQLDGDVILNTYTENKDKESIVELKNNGEIILNGEKVKIDVETVGQYNDGMEEEQEIYEACGQTTIQSNPPSRTKSSDYTKLVRTNNCKNAVLNTTLGQLTTYALEAILIKLYPPLSMIGIGYDLAQILQSSDPHSSSLSWKEKFYAHKDSLKDTDVYQLQHVNKVVAKWYSSANYKDYTYTSTYYSITNIGSF